MTVDQPGRRWWAVLRRQPAGMVEGRAEGGYTGAFEIICCECGDDPGWDYRQVSPKLRLIRGPYVVAVGIAAYESHLDWHERAALETHVGRRRPAASRR